MIVGFIVNPVAGMGGSVGLKGTDGRDVLLQARARGARPVASRRAAQALAAVPHLDRIDFLTAAGGMGENVLRATGASLRVVYAPPQEETSAADTKEACRACTEHGASLVVFVGGDGTARDVMDAVDERVPVLGIPSGVKMHSSVFATDPGVAGRLIGDFVAGLVGTSEEEVMDVDEEAFRQGRLSAALHGHLLVPSAPGLVQPVKGEYSSADAEAEKDEVAQAVAEMMSSRVLYILGPGTTIEALARKIGVGKTLLGVDAVLGNALLARDATESDLVRLLAEHPEAAIIVTPIGNQGFVFGRGNQQISPRVLRQVGKGHVIIVAAPAKLAMTSILRVDTGDAALDAELRGYVRVITGYRRSRLMKVV